MDKTKAILSAVVVLSALILASTAVNATNGEGVCVLVIDEDSIDNGNPYSIDNSLNFFSDWDVNDDIVDIGLREQLRYFAAEVGKNITLYTGEVGDEGWFAPETILETWNATGPTSDGLQNYLGVNNLVGPGLGTGDDPEALLDKIPDVIPLRADGLKMLEGQTICAVVYDSDVSTNYNEDDGIIQLDGSIKGDNLGIVAFKVIGVSQLYGYSSSSLPEVTIKIMDADKVCGGNLTLFNVPDSPTSSEPFDIVPDDVFDPGYVNPGYVNDWGVPVCGVEEIPS